MRFSALRLSVPGHDPHLLQQLTAKILSSSVNLRKLFRSVPPAQQEHGTACCQALQRDQNTTSVTSPLSRAANKTSPWSSASASATSTSPFCLSTSCYPPRDTAGNSAIAACNQST